MIATDLPWELARRLPWHVLSSPARQWAVMPSFVVGEYLFIACAAAAWVHAWRQGPERRKHLLVWIGALLAGTANDMIFMALPLVNNFWQAQATIMLTPRLPLYIPCVYVCFMYFPTVSVWRTGAPPLARAALTGLAAIVFYAPYDIVGAKFLWWTWHDSDPRIANRILGAPIGSTMWVIAFTAAFAWLLGRVVDKDPRVSTATFAKGIALVCGLSTVLMIVVMTPLQVLDGGMPGIRGLAVLVVVFAGIAWRGLRPVRPMAPRASDRLLLVAAVSYFATLVVIAATFDPAAHESTSLHQTYGPCGVAAIDITGARRFEYVCAEDFHEDFTFDCAAPPADGAQWYTVCGRPHDHFARWLLAVFGLGAAGTLLYAYLLGARRRTT
jgi:hypothetical protein